MRAVVLASFVALGCGSAPAPAIAPAPFPAPRAASSCPDLEVTVLDLDRPSLFVRGTRFVERAVPVVVSVGGRPARAVSIGSDGSISALLSERPRPGERVVLGYADGSEERSCLLP